LEALPSQGVARQANVVPEVEVVERSLRVVIVKPSKYAVDGSVERFRWGFMPNATLPYVRSMTPSRLGDVALDIHTVDEYVHTDLRYFSLLRGSRECRTLVALVGVQSHQFHRALDLAAYARQAGCMAVIGGPHAMTCDTSPLHGCGVSFALTEAELIWPQILQDASGGELQPVYGQGQRWQQNLQPPTIVPPPRQDFSRYIHPMLGLYPARGCPFICNFCSVIKIAGRRIRSQSIASLRAAKSAGVRLIMFTSDNFNKYPEAEALLEAMIEERLQLPFFVQCDTQISRQDRLVALLAKAGCFQMGVVELGLTSASFYVLCPIPGTDQYDEFMDQGLITEKNLDRFDTQCLTWRHPHFSREELARLLFDCYRKFDSLPRTLRHVTRSARPSGDMAMSLFNRYCAWRRLHPMSGGVMRVGRDSVREYLPLRREAFGFEQAPLPRSLALPPADAALTPVHSHASTARQIQHVDGDTTFPSQGVRAGRY
jgi:hypothetical protein